MRSLVFYVAAKPPVAGLVKTRLAHAIGASAAADLYAAFIEDIAAQVRGRGLAAGWFIPRSPVWQPPPLGIRQVATRWQRGDTWSERQANLFQDSSLAGYRATIVVASDSPQVTGSGMSAAAVALDDADVVLGPVIDGGYYLLGMRGDNDVVRGVEMSTNSACADIIRRADQSNLRVRMLPPTFDVDYGNDLEQLAAATALLPHLRATRAALGRTGFNNRITAAIGR